MIRVTRTLGALALAALSFAPFAGCSSGVVGGECKDGYSRCGRLCLDLRADEQNCGACGVVCENGQACVDGTCGGPTEGGVEPADGSAGGSAGFGGSGVGGSGGAAGGPNGGTSGGGTSSGGAGGVPSDGGAGGILLDAGAGGFVTDGGDASVGTGGTGAGGLGNGGAGGVGTGGKASGGSGGTSSGGSGGTSSGGSGGAGTGGDPNCQGPYDTAAQCGSCTQKCTPPAGLCEPGNDGYICVSLCTAPLVQCGTQCVNTDIDEDNCGRCNHRCASQICQGGQCVGATAGHVVVMCMDYRTQPVVGSPQQRLLGNAVFIPPGNPVRVLAYSQSTPAATITAVGRTLDAAATSKNRTYTITQAKTALAVTTALNVVDYDVLLVYDQPNAAAGALGATGATFQSPISSFVRAGGTVVVLAGDGGQAEMPAFLDAAGLLDARAQPGVTGNLLYNRALGDAVGLNVLSQFRAVRETCTFTLNSVDPAATFVITNQPASSGEIGNPVVVHTVVAP
ncbi:MAG TPA: hypothetical protein VHE30_04265 [Polyangiaceae bacterium]|nr:hypothetical protein [Polyangiaceae bacterium]